VLANETGGERLRVLHEDQALIVVDKPAGIHTAPLTPGESDTLLAFVSEAFPEVSGVPGIKASEPGLLHRLDRDTSGIVVFARTPAAFRALRSQFASGTVEKEYQAVCLCRSNRVSGESFAVRSMFAPAGPGRRKVRVVMPGEKSERLLKKASRALYETVAYVEKLRGERALVRAAIHKGFRHQIRAHLAFSGLPILGDSLYGEPAPADAPQRMYLHASGISLAHPVTGEQLRIISRPPSAFQALM